MSSSFLGSPSIEETQPYPRPNLDDKYKDIQGILQPPSSYNLSQNFICDGTCLSESFGQIWILWNYHRRRSPLSPLLSLAFSNRACWKLLKNYLLCLVERPSGNLYIPCTLLDSMICLSGWPCTVSAPGPFVQSVGRHPADARTLNFVIWSLL